MKLNWQQIDLSQCKNLQQQVECLGPEQLIDQQTRKDTIRVSLMLRHSRLLKDTAPKQEVHMKGKNLYGIVHSCKTYEKQVKRLLRKKEYNIV